MATAVQVARRTAQAPTQGLQQETVPPRLGLL